MSSITETLINKLNDCDYADRIMVLIGLGTFYKVNNNCEFPFSQDECNCSRKNQVCIECEKQKHLSYQHRNNSKCSCNKQKEKRCNFCNAGKYFANSIITTGFTVIASCVTYGFFPKDKKYILPLSVAGILCGQSVAKNAISLGKTIINLIPYEIQSKKD